MYISSYIVYANEDAVAYQQWKIYLSFGFFTWLAV